MKRREFLRGVGAGMLGTGGLVLAACGAAPAVPVADQTAAPPAASETAPATGSETAPAAAPAQQDGAQPQVNWQMTTSWPVSLDTIHGGAITISERVAAMTNGRFQIEVFPAGEIVPGLEVVQAVSQGTVQAGHSASYYYVGLDTSFAFGTAVPFGLNAQQQNAWLYHGGGIDLMRKVYANFNLIQFPAGNTGVQMGGWFRQQIDSTSDLQGLKMRIPGLGGQVMQRLGVNTQTLPGGEIFQALSTGAIDASEWVGPYDDQKLGLNDAAEFYYYPGWWEPGPTLDASVSLDAWNQLPKEYQEIFASACYESNINMLAKYDALNRVALKELVGKGAKLTPYSDEILAAAQKAAFELYDENAASNALFKEIYEPWKVFREEIYGWNATNELSFFNFVQNNKI